MKTLQKRMGALLLVLCMLFSMIPTVFAASTTRLELAIGSSTFSVNGISQQIDAQGSKATIVGDYTMLPITGIVKALGGETYWNASTRQVTIKLGDQTLVMTIDSPTAYLDGVVQTMQKAPYITNSRTLVHIRALELFDGVTCLWDDALRKVIVTYNPSAISGLLTLKVTNDTGATITMLNMANSATNEVTTASNLLSSSLADGSTATLQVPVMDNVTVYSLFATMGNSTGFGMYRDMNIAGVQNYVSVVLGDNNKMSYALDGVAQMSTTEMTFLNKSGVTIEELYFGTSSSSSTLAKGDDLLSKSVRDDATATFDIDLSDYTSWYFLAIDSSDEEYKGRVTFDDNDADEIYLKLKGADDDSFEEYDPDAVGSLAVAIVNDTGTDIKGMFLLDEDEAKNWKDEYIADADDDNEADNYGELEDYYSEYAVENSDIDDGYTYVAEDVFDTDTYDLVIYFGNDETNYVYIEGLDLSDADEAAVIYLESKGTYGKKLNSSNFKYFTDAEDQMLICMENDTGKTMTKITSQDKSGKNFNVLDTWASFETFADEDFFYYYIEDTTELPNDLDFTFKISGNNSYGTATIEKFESYIPFLKLTITEDRNKDAVIEDIFDVA